MEINPTICKYEKNNIFKGCIYLHMNIMPMFSVYIFLKPSAGRCY